MVDKDKAAQFGADELNQFWGEVVPDRIAAIGAEYLAEQSDAQEAPAGMGDDQPGGKDFKTGLDELLTGSEGAYYGGQGLDAILHDLAGRGFDAQDLNSWIDSAWSKSSEAGQDRAIDKHYEAGD